MSECVLAISLYVAGVGLWGLWLALTIRKTRRIEANTRRIKQEIAAIEKGQP